MATDKIESGLTKYYSELFKHLKDKKIKLLELGVLKGDGLCWFEDYFPNGEIIGFDIRPNSHFGARTKMINGNQNDSLALQELGNIHGMFDIIIDDCSHYGPYTQRSFDFLFKYLVPGGYYIFEDWSAGFRSPEFRGMDDVICMCIKNFDNYKLELVEAKRLSKGGMVTIVKKM